MTQHRPIQRTNPLNANLISFILIVNAIVIGGLIFANAPQPSSQSDGEAPVGVALGAITVTPPPQTLTATPLPPTASQAPPQTLTATPFSPTATSILQPTALGEFDGDAANGEVLFNTFQSDAGFACATCHRADSEDRLIGPGLLNIGERAVTRVEGLNAVDYIRDSIINPGDYVVEGFPDGLMPQTWAEIYSEDEINDLIAYLLTLN